MEHNLKIILEEYEKYKGQFIITDWQWQIHRFIGIGDDGTDWYYLTFDGRKIHWHSCVGSIIPLKGYLRDEDYAKIVRLAKLNDYDQLILKKDGNINNFLESIQKEINGYEEGHKFMTELCWDLN